MKKRLQSLYLKDIVDAITKILEYTKNVSYDDFCEDAKTIDAVVRNYEIIGEAAKSISGEIKSAYSDVPWKEMIGMRNKVIHEYFGVDTDIVWETTRSILPGLKTSLEDIYKSELKK